MPVARSHERPVQRREKGWPPLQKLANYESGSQQIAVWRNWCAPGEEVRTHRHDVEEVITVIRGRMHAWIGDEQYTLEHGDALIVPPMEPHGFRNPGPDRLEIVASLASAKPETLWDDEVDKSGLHLDQLLPHA